MPMKPRVAVIGFAEGPFSPRAQRVNALASHLSQVADVELINGTRGGHQGVRRSSRTRHWLGELARLILLDRYELEAARRLRTWHTSADVAILIGFPFSPVTWAARRLARLAVPYVVDFGDPWALTAPPPRSFRPAVLRARRCERFIWERAAGGILTTEQQAETISRQFPQLPILVRPNGFPIIANLPSPPRSTGRRDHLRIVHYGNLYSARLDLPQALQAILKYGDWKTVTFTLYGTDWDRSFERSSASIAVETHVPLPWNEVVASAYEHDVALVVGNRNPAQLPSKAVTYLTLPIPRMALVSGMPHDALAAYLADKPGWLTISAAADPAQSAARLADHIAVSWRRTDLQAPQSESWQTVTTEVAEFVSTCTAVNLSGVTP